MHVPPRHCTAMELATHELTNKRHVSCVCLQPRVEQLNRFTDKFGVLDNDDLVGACLASSKIMQQYCSITISLEEHVEREIGRAHV